VFISRDALKTEPPGVMVLVTESFTIGWKQLMASSCMMTLPILTLRAHMRTDIIRLHLWLG
jgi:ABC-type glycerol-3-phosphate transport system permease component